MFWEDRGKILNDFLRASRTGAKDCGARAREAMAASAKHGDVVNLTQFLGYAAALYLRQRAVAEGRAALAEAFELMERTEPRYYRAELHRLDGELLRVGGAKPSAPEECFRQALHVAREQRAKALELRAAMSLGHLWQTLGKKAEARALVQG